MLLGIVVFHDAAQDCAIIWCEDGGHLIYARAVSTMLGKAAPLAVGDLVDTNSVQRSGARFCTRLRIVRRGYLPQVVGLFMAEARAAAPSASTAGARAPEAFAEIEPDNSDWPPPSGIRPCRG